MCKRNGEYIFMHINLACWFSMGHHRGNDTNYPFAASRKKTNEFLVCWGRESMDAVSCSTVI